MFNAKIVDNFLDKDLTDKILEFARSVDLWESGGSDFWANRCLNPEYINKNFGKEIPIILKTVNNMLQQKIKDLYGMENIYSDLFQIVRWFEGMEQPPHCDDMKDSEGTEAFHHREFGAIIYLNDDYDGGHTFYPQHNFEVIPKSGTLAIHPGDTDHFHGVTKISGGMRYTLASFWTSQKEKEHEWPIY